MSSSRLLPQLSSIFALAYLLAASVSHTDLRAQASTDQSDQVQMFSALRNQTLLAAYASRAKALVTPEGYIQRYQYSPVNYPKEITTGPLLKWHLWRHSIDLAAASQRITTDSAPTVETKFVWPKTELVLTAFAAEPEADGYYVRAEVANRGKVEEEFRVEFTLSSSPWDLAWEGARFAADKGAVDANGNVLLHPVAVGDEATVAAWRGATTPKPGVIFTFTLKPGQKRGVAVAMPAGGQPAKPSFAAAHQATGQAWEHHIAGGINLSIPDAQLQAAWNFIRKQLGMFLEPQPDGVRVLAGIASYHFSCPYSTLQAVLAFDQLRKFETADTLLRWQLKRVRPDGVFEMWERTPPATNQVDQWVVQGLAPLAVWRHYQFVRNPEWLREAWPVLRRSVEATRAARRGAGSSGKQGGFEFRGLLPGCFNDGGLPPTGYSIPQNIGALAGIRVALESAKILELPEKTWLQAEYDDFRAVIIELMKASQVKVGDFSVMSSYLGADTSEAVEHMWGAIEGVYPLDLFAPDDPLLIGSLRYLQADKSHGLHLHLGASRGVWPYMSAAVAHWHLRLGEYDEAWRIFQAIMDHATPTWGWFEEIERNPYKANADSQQLWAAAEYIQLVREFLLFENKDELLLAAGIPDSWTQPGKKVSIGPAPTLLGGRCSFQAEWLDREARGKVTLTEDLKPKTIRIKLLPTGVGQPKVSVAGADVESIDGKFINLVNCSKQIEVRASW